MTSAVVGSAVVPSAGLLLHRRRVFEWVVVPHPFLATQLPPSDGAASLFRSSVAGTLFELVADHVVQGRVIFPGAGYLELGRAATRAEALHSVFFLQPLAIEVPNLLIECAVTEDGRFEVCSREDAASVEATVHCSGSFSRRALTGQRAQADPPSWRGRVCTRVADVDAMYDGFDAVGLQYGPAYRTLERAFGNALDAAAAALRVRSSRQGTVCLLYTSPSPRD